MSVSATPPAAYPEGWEADIVLRDGRPAHLRPIRPGDADALRRFHARLSPQTVYLRFFGPRPSLSPQEVDHFTQVDYADRVALVATERGEIIGVGRYDRINQDEAEVAFVIEDAHQGRGLGALLLEHLVAVGRECGIRRFVAEVLPQNGRMLTTFTDAGFLVSRAYDEGVIQVSFDLAVTPVQRHVQESREHRSESRSLARVLAPRSIAVVGVSRTEGSIGHELLRHLVMSDFQGLVYGVHPEAQQILGVTCYPSLSAIGAPVDLVVVAVRAEVVPAVVQDAAAIGVRGLVIVSEGFPGGSDLQRSVVAAAREGGIRVIGPAALGIINTDPAVRLNASLARWLPERDSIGFFCQSGALGIDILARLARRGLGVSSFVSAGNRADVSGNDLLQYWEEDDSTSLVMLYLESIGNPRKFLRIARRIGQVKPVIALRAVGAMQTHPLGHDVPVSKVSAKAKEQLFARSGIIDAASLDEMLDVAEVARLRGIPHGGRVGIVANSDAIALLARNIAEQVGLGTAESPRIADRVSSSDAYRRLLDEAGRDDAVDIVVAIYVPPIESSVDSAVREVIATCAAAIDKPTIAVVLGWTAQELRQAASHRAGHRALPVFTDVEHAMRAVGHLARYARWRQELTTATDDLPEVDVESARAVLREAAQPRGAELTDDQARALMSAYGVVVGDGLAEAQAHAMPGLCIRAHVDPLVGPLISIGLAGPLAQALEDVSYAVPPVSQHDAQAMVTGLGVARLLELRGEASARLAEALVRVGSLITDWPQIGSVDCAIPSVQASGPLVASVRIVLQDDPDAPLREVRRLTG